MSLWWYLLAAVVGVPIGMRLFRWQERRQAEKYMKEYNRLTDESVKMYRQPLDPIDPSSE